MARPLRKLLAFLLVVACLFAVGVVSTGKKGATSNPVDSDAVDLICHTDNPAECYPRIFQATDEFQPVHEDQDLPPGLHVRLNIWTGAKEAKLNNESEDAPAALKGLPVDQSVVLVDQPAEDAATDGDGSSSGAKLPKGAPAYDPVGLVKKPEADEGGGGAGHEGSPGQAFYDAVAVVKGVAGGLATGSGDDAAGASSPVVAAEQARFDDALETLMDVSHDIYYGLKLAEDTDAVRLLFCLGGGASGSSSKASAAVAQKASSIVAAALQNNPAALREVERIWSGGKTAGCTETHDGPSGGAGSTLADLVYGPFVPSGSSSSSDGTTTAADPAWVRSRLLAVSSLLKSEVILQDFLASGGLTEVLRVLVEQTAPAYDAVRTRAANLVLDNFLDASMGADVSQWAARTAGAKGDEKQAACADAGGQVLGHCWDYHAEKLAETHRGEGSAHWAAELWRRLQEREETAKTADEADHSEL